MSPFPASGFFSGLVYLESHVLGGITAPCWPTPPMMQVKETPFQAKVRLNEQTTDPKNHTPVRNVYILYTLALSPANSDGVETPNLAELSNFSDPGQIRDLHCQWEPDGSRAWEDELRQELLSTRESESD